MFYTATICLDENLTIDQEKDFLNSVVEFFKAEKKIDFICSPPVNAVFNVYPSEAVSAAFGTYLIDLSLSEEILWDKLHSKHRNVIRKAMKDQVNIKRGKEYLDLAYKLIKETQLRSDKGFSSIEKFKELINSLENNVEIFVSFYKDKPQGCAVFLYSDYAVYYRHGGSIERPFTGSLNLLHWEAIKYFKAKGVLRYDFLGARIKPDKGSKLEGIQRFKSRFGGELRQGYLWKLVVRKWKYRLFQFIFAIKNGTFEEDIIDQEIKKAKKDNEKNIADL